MMKQNTLWMALILATTMLVACGEKTEAPATDAASTKEIDQDALPAAPKPAVEAPAAGGYEPTAEERVPGITMTQDELDKLYNENKTSEPKVGESN